MLWLFPMYRWSSYCLEILNNLSQISWLVHSRVLIRSHTVSFWNLDSWTLHHAIYKLLLSPENNCVCPYAAEQDAFPQRWISFLLLCCCFGWDCSSVVFREGQGHLPVLSSPLSSPNGEALNASLGWMCSLMLSFISASRMLISQNHQEKTKIKTSTKSSGTIGGLTKAKGLLCAKTSSQILWHGSKYTIKLMGKDFRDRF